MAFVVYAFHKMYILNFRSDNHFNWAKEEKRPILGYPIILLYALYLKCRMIFLMGNSTRPSSLKKISFHRYIL